MKIQKLKSASLILIFILAYLSFTQSVLAKNILLAQDNTPTPDVQPQIILVMDISESMGNYIIPNPPPDEIQKIWDNNKSPELVQYYEQTAYLAEQMDAIWERPDLKSLENKELMVRYERLIYIQDNLGVDLFDRILDMENILVQYGCGRSVARFMIDSVDLKHAFSWIDYSCPNMPQDQRNELSNKLDFLNDEQVQKLSQEALDLSNQHSSILYNSTDYGTYEQQNSDLVISYRDKTKKPQGFGSPIDETAQRLGLPSQLDISKSVASSIVDLLELNYLVNKESRSIGLVVFTTYAKELFPLNTDTQSVRSAIDGLEEQTGTSVAHGLHIALQMSKESGSPTTIILLSDGQTNTGPGGSLYDGWNIPTDPTRDFIMNTLSEQAKAQNAKIFSVGFGSDENYVDAELLRQLSDKTGGKYLFTSTLNNGVMNFLIECVQPITVENETSFQGSMNSGEAVNIGRFDVKPNTAELTLSFNFVNMEPNLLITAPSGKQIASNDSGVTLTSSSGWQLWKIANPEIGSWKVEANSSGNKKDMGVYYLGVSTKINEVPPTADIAPSDIATKNGASSTGSIVLWSSLICVGVVLVFIWIQRSSAQPKDSKDSREYKRSPVQPKNSRKYRR